MKILLKIYECIKCIYKKFYAKNSNNKGSFENVPYVKKITKKYRNMKRPLKI